MTFYGRLIGFSDYRVDSGYVHSSAVTDYRVGRDCPVRSRIATAEGTRTVASKWNGAVPSSISLWWLPSSLSDWVGKALAPGK